MRRRAIPGGSGRVAAVLPAEPRTHTKGSSREFVVWAAMPPASWIRLPRFFADEPPSRGPLELWLQHAGCCSLATGGEVKVVPLVMSS